MKWILASTTALALTMGGAQFSLAQDSTPPATTEENGTMQDNDTLLENQPATPEPGAETTQTEPEVDPNAEAAGAAPETDPNTDAAGAETETDPNAAATDVAPATEPDTDVTMDSDMMVPTDTMSARDLIGADVVGPDGNSVGAVDDLVLDANGAIEQVIIADGAVLGFGGKNVAIGYPGATVSQEADGSDPVVRISMTEEALGGAAEFDKGQLEQQGDRLASSYLDRDVSLASSDATGEIDDLLIDQGGTVTFAVIQFGGLLGMGAKDAVVAFDKLSGAPEGEPMQLSLSEAELEAAPNFDEIQPAAGN